MIPLPTSLLTVKGVTLFQPKDQVPSCPWWVDSPNLLSLHLEVAVMPCDVKNKKLKKKTCFLAFTQKFVVCLSCLPNVGSFYSSPLV